MQKILQELERKETNQEKINIGLVGSGQMGSGIVHVTSRMPGAQVSVIADLDVKKGIKAFKEVGYSDNKINVCETAQKAQKSLEKGKVVVIPDASIIVEIPALEAIVEATGSTEVGARIAYQGILNQKHIIMLNVETDVTVGCILKSIADKAGVVYTASAGDEPGAVMELYRLARCMGFKVVTIGKGKNNPVNHHATPDQLKEEALSKDMNPKMLTSFVDGTKTMVELAEMSNATGAIPDKPGAHGAKVDLEDLEKVFIPEKDGGILKNDFVVDYSTGKVAPGVFVVMTTDSDRVHKGMNFYSMGDGPYYKLFRPYHLCSFETPVSVARACITGEHTVNTAELNSEVVAMAKRDLSPGDKIDGIGGFDMYGKTYAYSEASEVNALPMGIAKNAVLKNKVKQDDIITYDDVKLDNDSFVVQLRRLQDSLFNK